DNFKQNNYDTVYGSKILKYGDDDKWSLTLISGVRDANNNLIGSIYITMNWQELINKLKKLKLDETGRLFALDNDGII
ncbi:chemotaxis protein, partial [Brachyspira hampsonii]|nr:chemotaxis protein [Brachyspira hampsonii]